MKNFTTVLCSTFAILSLGFATTTVSADNKGYQQHSKEWYQQQWQKNQKNQYNKNYKANSGNHNKGNYGNNYQNKQGFKIGDPNKRNMNQWGNNNPQQKNNQYPYNQKHKQGNNGFYEGWPAKNKNNYNSHGKKMGQGYTEVEWTYRNGKKVPDCRKGYQVEWKSGNAYCKPSHKSNMKQGFNNHKRYDYKYDKYLHRNNQNYSCKKGYLYFDQHKKPHCSSIK